MPARADTASLVHEKVLALLLTEKPGRLLDAPAGEGAFAARARDLGHEVICGDVDTSRFRIPGLECRRLDLNRIWPFAPASFEYVVLIEAMEHLENPWHAAREANRLLTRDGKLFLTTPNVLTLRSRLSYLLYGYPNYFHYMIEQRQGSPQESSIDHINPLGFLELRHVLARSGFQIDAIETNRYLKRGSALFQFLRLLLQTRGRSQVRHDPAKASVRQTLLSPVLLFGEILIIKARKVRDVDPAPA